MQSATFQPRVSNASMAGQRPLEWPMVETLKKHDWEKRFSGEKLKEVEAKYLRDKDTLQGTYKDFEAHFVTQLLNAMNKTVQKNEMFHGGQVEDMFMERMNDELGKRIVEGGKGFGIAEMLEQQHLRKTYYGSEKSATLIWKDIDAKLNEGVAEKFKNEVGKVNSAGSRLADAPSEADANGEKSEDAMIFGETYQARKARLMASEGLEGLEGLEMANAPEAVKLAMQKQRGERDKSIQERMAELQAATAYQYKNAKTMNLR